MIDVLQNNRTTTFSETTGRIFFSNIEEALAEDGEPVTGELAEKVREISSRTIWYRYGTVVLPARPDSDFVEYAAQLGREPQIIVPKGLDPDNLSIVDGFSDPNIQELVRGCEVASYMGSRALYEEVTKYGGIYEGGDPGDTVQHANNKENFIELAKDVVSTPPGVVARGIEDISQAVLEELRVSEGVYVRLTENAGGGLGNRSFTVNPDGSLPSLDEIKKTLYGNQPEAWEDGKALVQTLLDMKGSPSVAFRAGEGAMYDAKQITKDRDFMGCFTPAPPESGHYEELHEIGGGLARKLGAVGYCGIAGVDLGIDSRGRIVGFEINGRNTGTRHAVEIGELLYEQSWDTWRKEGHVVKTRDHFVLQESFTFSQFHEQLGKAGWLATPENPFGVVISIPPVGNVVGIAVLGEGYADTERRYQEVMDKFGNPAENKEDHPLKIRR